ncbi:unnamed protein product [Ectocarpus sp. CCAP 1310/34]|nr:unnamed protein product [Ectocarpus sp. CCAP 1310/34]
MKPIAQAAIMAVCHEPVPDGETDEGFDEMLETVEWQVNCVLEEKGKSVYEHAQRFIVATIWETGYRFQFGPGRIASKLDKNVSDITEQDAVNAFIPYLDNPTNGPGFDDDGNETDGEEYGNGLGGDGSGGDGSGGDRGTNRGNVEAGEQRGADEDAVPSERTNKEMTDGGGASGSGVRKAD